MKVSIKDGKTTVLFDEADERIAWQITAARQQKGDATLKNEFLKTVEEMSRLHVQLAGETVMVRRPNEMWTFRIGADGRLSAEIGKG